MTVDATSIIDYTYSDFLAGIQSISQQIDQSGWTPDYIVGIVRGGAVPAVYLSHVLKIPVVMVLWNTRDNTHFGNESNAWIPEDLLEGKKVLLVDDIVDGGETVKEILADWQTSVRDPLPVDSVRIASLIYNTSQDVPVDFFDKMIDRDEDQRWVIFPWES